MTLFTIGLATVLLNAYNTYYYSYLLSDDDYNTLNGLINQFVDDPYIAALKVVAVGLFFYLTLRKDTRVACGISKEEKVDMDELDHLL